MKIQPGDKITINGEYVGVVTELKRSADWHDWVDEISGDVVERVYFNENITLTVEWVKPIE